MTYPRGPGYPGHREAYMAAVRARLAASHRMPSGVPFGSIVAYAEAELAAAEWTKTKWTLHVAQRKGK